MNATEPKPVEEVLESLADAGRVFVLGCNGCHIG